MKFKERRLTPLLGAPRQTRIVVWDIETTVEGMDPFLVGVRWGLRDDEACQFKGTDCMARFLEWLLFDADQGEDTLYFAHNGGGFDHLFLIYEMIERQPGRFKVRPVLSGSSAILVIVEDKQTSRKFMLVDSLRLLNMSLKKIGKALGGPQKQDFDIHTDPSDPRWLEYNNLDTLVLYEAVTKVQEALLDLGGQMKVTAASSSMDLFRRAYLKKPIPPVPTKVEELMRKFYFGGRVEIFDLRRRTDVKLFDVNSLYPHACTYPLPIELEERQTDWTINSVERLDHAHSVGLSWFVRCAVEVPDNVFAGPLPVRRARPKGLFYPIGRFRGMWNSYDLRNLLLCGGRIIHFDYAFRYRCEPIAKQMMMDLYAQRLNKMRPEMGLAAKLIMNSWYGKTGQKTERESMIYSPDPEDMEEGVWTCEDADTDLWSSTYEKHEPHIMPQIAAQVTAIARSVHYPYLLNSRDPVYCDTDCLVQSTDMDVSMDLGKMKLEADFAWFQAYLPKLYHGLGADGEMKNRSKGFGGWNKETFEQGIVSHLAAGGSVKVKGPAKLKTLMGGISLKPNEKILDKRVRSCYDKRVVLADGRTRPIKLSEV